MSIRERIPSWAWGTTIERDLMEEEQEQVTTRRGAAVKALRAAQRRREKELPSVRAAAEAADMQMGSAWAAYETAAEAARLAGDALRMTRASIEAQQSRALQEMRVTAAPEIYEAIRELEQLWEQGRRTPVEEIRVARYTNSRRTTISITNASSMSVRMGALRAAIRELELLKESPDADVPARIAELRAGIPEVESLEGEGVKVEASDPEPDVRQHRASEWVTSVQNRGGI